MLVCVCVCVCVLVCVCMLVCPKLELLDIKDVGVPKNMTHPPATSRFNNKWCDQKKPARVQFVFTSCIMKAMELDPDVDVTIGIDLKLPR